MTSVDRDELRKIAEECEREGEGMYLHPGTVIALLDRNTRAEARIKAVRELHAPSDHGMRDRDGNPRFSCEECREPQDGYNVEWPCPTIRALDGTATPRDAG